jgi:hypothetical protein
MTPSAKPTGRSSAAELMFNAELRLRGRVSSKYSTAEHGRRALTNKRISTYLAGRCGDHVKEPPEPAKETSHEYRNRAFNRDFNV